MTSEPSRVGDTEVLMPVYRVIEWKDGAVYKTMSLGERWIPLNQAIPGKEIEPNVRLGTPTRFMTRRKPQ